MAKGVKIILGLLKALGALLSIALAAAFVISAYGGVVDPMVSARFSVAALAFPVMLVLMVVLLVLWLVLRQWLIAAVVALALIISGGPILSFFPVNIGGGLPESDTSRSFKVLTYNVMNFDDFTGEEHTPNRTIQFVLDTDADVVCLQETSMGRYASRKEVVKMHLEKLAETYPYCYFDKMIDVAVFSKYPFTGDDSVKVERRDKFVSVGIDIAGRRLRLFNCHLQSIGLRDEDKELYRELTELKKIGGEGELDEVRETLISKLAEAFRQRSLQARELRDAIDAASEPNVLVCGDFNDIPSSYAQRTIMGSDMRDAYRDCAFGARITFHSDRFYFRIDHVLYRGDFRAADIERNTIDCSDHYPLVTTFVWNDK